MARFLTIILVAAGLMAACGGDDPPAATEPPSTGPVATIDPTTTLDLDDDGTASATTTIAPTTTLAPSTTLAPPTSPPTTPPPTTVPVATPAGPEQLDWVLEWSAELTFSDGERVTVTHTGPFQVTTEPGKAGSGRELVGLTNGSISGLAVVTGTGGCRAEAGLAANFDGAVSGTWYPGDVFELVVEVTEVRDATDISTDCGGFVGEFAEQAYADLASLPGSPFLPAEFRTALVPGPVSLRFDGGNPNIHNTINVSPAGG